MIMFAIREPLKDAHFKKERFIRHLYAHSPENHVQRDGYIEVKRPIVNDARDEEEYHQCQVILELNLWLDGAEFRCEDEAVESDEKELGKCD